MKITLLEPHGYCAGVTNAIKMAYKARKTYKDKPIYILGMLVHNSTVIEELSKQNIITLSRDKDDITTIKSLKKDSILIFSAHGHDSKLDQVAKEQGLIIFDATCPIVKKNLETIKNEIKNEHQIIYIGNNHHPETQACLAIDKNVLYYDFKADFNFKCVKDEAPLVINQTTYNTIDLLETYKIIQKNLPSARIQNEICNTTRLRQEAVKNIIDADLIIVIGDSNSSNSKRLLEIAKITHPNIESILIRNKESIDLSKYKSKKHIYISSGASTPSFEIDGVIEELKK